MEFPPEGGKATIYAASGKSEVTQAAGHHPGSSRAGQLVVARCRAGTAARSLRRRNGSLAGPQPMETYDSFQNRYGWYRATLHPDKPGPVSLHFGGQSGTFIPYLNGQPGTTTTLTYGQSGSLTSRRARRATTPSPSSSRRPRDPRLFRELVGMRTARGLWGGVSADAASTPVDVSWKKWDKATARCRSRRARQSPTTTIPLGRRFDPASRSTTTRGDSWYRGTFNVDRRPSRLDAGNAHFDPPPPERAENAPAAGQGHRLSQRPVAAGPTSRTPPSSSSPARTPC